MEFSVELKEVGKSYASSFLKSVPVLRNISYRFEAGKFYAVMGCQARERVRY